MHQKLLKAGQLALTTQFNDVRGEFFKPRENVQSADYPKDELETGIVHFGLSHFARGHWFEYIHDVIALMRNAGNQDWNKWGITAITTNGDNGKRQILEPQDFSYHIVARNSTQKSIRRVDSLIDIVHAPSHINYVMDLLASADTKLITMTITQDGYKSTGTTHKSEPETVIGYLAHAMEQRRVAGIEPPVFVSLDNMDDNSEQLRKALMQEAETLFPGLPAYIEKAEFLNTMVDRIVPSTDLNGRHEIDTLAKDENIVDAWPIFTEPDKYLTMQRPHKDMLPPQFFLSGLHIDFGTPEHVKLRELMKIRLLNGTHFAVGLIGLLADYRFIGEALKDPDIRDFAHFFVNQARQSLDIAGQNLKLHLSHSQTSDKLLDEFVDKLFTRLDNPFNPDPLPRLVRAGSSKLQPRLVGAAQDLASASLPHQHSALAAAAWVHFIRDRDVGGTAKTNAQADPAVINEGYKKMVTSPHFHPLQILPLTRLFGTIYDYDSFQADYLAYYDIIAKDGIGAALKHANDIEFARSNQLNNVQESNNVQQSQDPADGLAKLWDVLKEPIPSEQLPGRHLIPALNPGPRRQTGPS